MRLLPLVLLLALAAPAVTHAQGAPPVRTLTVSATDTLRVAPDRAVLRFAVVTRSRQPEEVRRLNDEASRRALDAVRALGVPERQIQVRQLSLGEDVEFRDGRRVRLGFVARRAVEVVLDDLDLLPAVVAAVVEQGATELGGIAYEVRDRRAHEDEALRRAAQRARQKADVLASTLGATLRGVHSVSESSTTFAPPMPWARTAMFDVAVAAHAEADPGAYAPGEITVEASITVVFELE